MSTEPYRAVHLDDVPFVEPTEPRAPRWQAVRHHLGVEPFGVNAFVAAAPGDFVVEEHDELEAPGSGSQAAPHLELYYVARGHVTFDLGGETLEAPAGTLVYVGDPALKRSAVAHAAGDTILAFGAPAGVPYEVSAWEGRELADAAS